MPIFDFHCAPCDTTFEKMVRSGEAVTCPHCGGTVDKLMSAPQPPGKSKSIIAGARQQAAREGHFSHYRKSERPRH